MKMKYSITSPVLVGMAAWALIAPWAAYWLREAEVLSDATVEFLANAAAVSGLFLVVVGILLAVMALKQTERSNDLGIAAARQWLLERRKLESQIDYLFFASPHIFGEIVTPGKASMTDAAKSLIAVIGTLRRLRDNLLGYTQNHGLLLGLAIARKSAKKATADQFGAYMQAYDSRGATPTTTYLENVEGWLFKGASQGGEIALSIPTTVRALTTLVCTIDYLDARTPSIQAILEKGSCDSNQAADVLEPSQAGQEMFDALDRSLKEIFAHLTVLRACLEREWALLFPQGFANNAAGEDAIRDLLAEGDGDRFVFAAQSPGTRESIAGYRFGHGLRQLSRLGVFDDGSGTHSRIKEMYPTASIGDPAA